MIKNELIKKNRVSMKMSAVIVVTVITVLLFGCLPGFISTADAASQQTDTEDSSFEDFDYFTQPYGGFGPNANVTYDEDGTPISVNGYPTRLVRAGFSNMGELHKFETYFVEYPFWQSATQYDGNLACMSLAMSLSANRNVPQSDATADETDTAGELEQFLGDAGFTDIRKDDYSKDTSMFTLSTAIGQQTISHEGEGSFTLIAVGACGANYTKEWQSNIDVGTDDVHSGFAHASQLVMDRLDSYIRDNHIKGHIKIWISGISRAAAVANLTAGRLTYSGAFPKEDVFAYTFATPAVMKNVPEKGFENIHNIIDPMDAVPQFPPAAWGYGRYGNDYYLQVQEFVSRFGFLATGVRDEMNQNDWGVENNYSPELNLRMRLLLSMIFETVGDSENYTDVVYPALISIMQDGSKGNMIRTLRNLELQGKKASPETRSNVDGLVDYAFRVIMPLVRRAGYRDADSNSGNLGMRLMAEHTQNTYLANVACIRGSLYMNADYFYYVMVRGPVSVSISWKGEEGKGTLLHISPDGEVSIDKATRDHLGEGFTRMLTDSLYIERIENTTVIAIPMDNDHYQVDWTAESAGTVQSLQLRCTTDVSVLYDGARSEALQVSEGDTGTSFIDKKDGTILPQDFEKVSMSGLQIAEFTGLESPTLNWRIMLTCLCAIIGLLLGVAVCLILFLALRRRFGLPVWTLICLLSVSLMESVMAYWFLADMPLIQILWMCVAGLSLIALVVLIRKKNQTKA